jgi:hypothetical protein
MPHRIHIAPTDGHGHLKNEFFLLWNDEFHGEFIAVKLEKIKYKGFSDVL